VDKIIITENFNAEDENAFSVFSRYEHGGKKIYERNLVLIRLIFYFITSNVFIENLLFLTFITISCRYGGFGSKLNLFVFSRDKSKCVVNCGLTRFYDVSRC